MKITDLQTHLLTARWEDDPAFPRMLHSTVLVRIITDANIDGIGEATCGYFAPEAIPALVEHFKPVVLGRDPFEVNAIAQAMLHNAIWWARTGAGRSVLGGIELALWDLKAKALGVPLHQLLGGKVREEIPVYASGGPTNWPLEDNVRKVAWYAERGYRMAKLSTNFYALEPTGAAGAQGRLTPVALPFADRVRTLAQCFERLRREFGVAMDFAIDGHEGGKPNAAPVTEALAIDEAVAPYRIRFYEEPLAYTNLDGYRELRARAHIPIAGGESLCGLDQFHALIASQAVNVVQPDLGFAGGLQETLRIVHHADAFNIRTALHTGASAGPCLAASWHLATAAESIEWLEHVPAARSVHEDLLVERFEIRNGTVSAPTAPGLGVKLTSALLEKYRFVPNSGERT